MQQINFQADPDVLKLIRKQGHGEKRRVINNAIRNYFAQGEQDPPTLSQIRRQLEVIEEAQKRYCACDRCNSEEVH